MRRSMPGPDVVPKLLTMNELAERLGVTPRHVRRLVTERRVPFLKVGRFIRFDPAAIAVRLEPRGVAVSRDFGARAGLAQQQATLDDHEGDTFGKHEFVNMLSPWWSLRTLWYSGWRSLGCHFGDLAPWRPERRPTGPKASLAPAPRSTEARKARTALGGARGSVGRFDAARRPVQDGRVRAGEEEPLVPVRPAHQVRGRPVGPPDLDDLALTATLTYVLTANFDVVSQ